MSKKYKDFDNFFKESNSDQNISIKLFGKIYILPKGIKASLALKMLRLRKEGGSNEIDVMDTALELLGKENVSEWLKKGIYIDQLEKIIEWAFKEYNFGPGTEVKKKE